MVKGDRVNGFTLLELIVFVVVAGIFIPMAYIAFMTASRSAAQPDAVMRARFLAETKMEDLTGMTYAAITTPQTSYISVTLDPRFGSPPMPWPNPYTGYQWRWTIQDVAYQGRTTHGSPTLDAPEPWQANTVYRVGDYVKKTTASAGETVHFYRCVPRERWQANISYATGIDLYVSPTTPNDRSYRATARLLSSFPVWQGSRPYALGDYVVPTVASGHSYRCSGAGMSGPAEPSPWPLAGTIVDGTVTWTENTNTITTSEVEPNPWPATAGETVNDGSVTWVTEPMRSSASTEPAWETPPVNDGSLRWQESTVYKQITVYVREPKGYEYVANTIVTARPKAYP